MGEDCKNKIKNNKEKAEPTSLFALMTSNGHEAIKTYHAISFAHIV